MLNKYLFNEGIYTAASFWKVFSFHLYLSPSFKAQLKWSLTLNRFALFRLLWGGRNGRQQCWDEEVWGTRMGQLGWSQRKDSVLQRLFFPLSLCTGSEVATRTGYTRNKVIHTGLWLVRTVNSNHLATISGEEDWKPFQGRGLGGKWDKMAATDQGTCAVRGRGGSQKSSFWVKNYCSKGFRVFKPLGI